METKLAQFLRIANALLRRQFPFKPQRRAMIAKLWVRHLDQPKKNI